LIQESEEEVSGVLCDIVVLTLSFFLDLDRLTNMMERMELARMEETRVMELARREETRVMELARREETRVMELARREEMTKITQAVVLQGTEIRGYMKIVSYQITPSDGAESTAEDKWILLMETLNLNRTMKLSSIAALVDVTSCTYEDFTYPWPIDDSDETASYVHLAGYLSKCGRHVHIVGNGQNLPHGHFFTVNVYTLRKKIGVRSAEGAKN
jgi:hypothetical protein